MVAEFGFMNINIGDVYLKCETIIHIPIVHVVILDKIWVHSVTKYYPCNFHVECNIKACPVKAVIV